MKRAKRLLLSLAALALGLLIIELQFVDYVAVYARGQVTDAPLPGHVGGVPETVFAAVDAENLDSLTLVALGDSARCKHSGTVGRLFPSILQRLGVSTQVEFDRARPDLTEALSRRWPQAPVLALGDMAYDRGTLAEFETCFEPVWYGEKQRMLPTPGNHEYGSPGAVGYFEYWGERAGPTFKGYYALRWHDWLILSLNSEIDAGPDTPQGRWLQSQLATAGDDCIMAFFHTPAHSLETQRSTRNAKELFGPLHDAGASFVVSGHNHFYERTRPMMRDGTRSATVDGTVQFVVGTGGARGHMGRLSDVTPRTAASSMGHLGALRLELRDGGYEWWFHTAPKAEVLDHGRAVCRHA